jgi:hypothetical protein
MTTTASRQSAPVLERITDWERDAERTMLAEARNALSGERVRAERLEAALAETRRPWLAKVIDGLRRKAPP